MTAPQTSRWWERALAPRVLLLGCALAFLACCAAGRVVSRVDLYRDFQRFHSFINFESLYHPTASQALALARARLAPGQVAVVVGGSSVLFGYNQSERHLWTRQLQALLGDRYRVFNFGLPGGVSGEFGAVAAESLEREHREVLCVTDTWAGTWSTAGEVDGALQKYFFWDAYHKGLLRRDSEREAGLAELAAAREDDAAYAELRRRSRLGAWLYCEDLWTTFSYRCAATVWCPPVAASFTRARRRYADPDAVRPYEQRYWAARDREVLPLAEQTAFRHWPGTPPPGPEADYSGTPLVRSFRRCFPPACRRRTLILVDHINPHYVRLLPPDLRARHAADYPETVRALEQAGFAPLEVGREFTEVDYSDLAHVSAEGAGKLAAEVAPAVRRLARALGYAP